MLKAVMKEQLQELLTTMRSSKKRKVSFKTNKAAQKRKVIVDSDTNNSLHEMEETPEPADNKNSASASNGSSQRRRKTPSRCKRTIAS